MSTQNQFNSQFKAQAIILLSGKADISILDKATAILNSYTLKILEQQNIDIAGRIISAILIGFDPAHAHAIEQELVESMAPHQIDVAMELI